MTYHDLQQALAILNLTDRVTMRDIKEQHRALVKQHHPDAGGTADHAQISRINAAYAILLSYVTHYRFSFSEAEFYEQNPEERLRCQFSDPLWGENR